MLENNIYPQSFVDETRTSLPVASSFCVGRRLFLNIRNEGVLVYLGCYKKKYILSDLRALSPLDIFPDVDHH